ncbi:MAG: fibrobacter succinogenes major paralogous domain-containing protein [Polaribacter sp.]
MKKLKFPLLVLFTLFLFQCSNDDSSSQEEAQPETLTDADGNVYNTIKMGNQIWMLENLKTTKYNDGTPITFYDFGIHANNWGATGSNFNSVGFYKWADTSDLSDVIDEELPFDYYGAMYNHFAIESGKLAPEGWRIPTKEDFEELENFVASQGFAGNEATALKTVSGWLPSTGGGTNDFGFNALPNGYVNTGGTSTLGNGVCTWATSDVIEQGTVISSNRRVFVRLSDGASIVYEESSIKLGAGIRCIKIQ